MESVAAALPQEETNTTPMIQVDVDSITCFSQVNPVDESAISRNLEGRRLVDNVMGDDELDMVETLMPLLKPNGSYAGGVHQAHAIIGDRVLQASPQLRSMGFTVKEVWGFVHKYLQKRGFTFRAGFIEPTVSQRARIS